MSAPAELLERLASAGCSVAVAGDRLRVRGPHEVLTPALLGELRERKPELLEALRTSAPTHSDLLRRAGDVAEAIHRHCAACHSCRVEWFTSDNVAPFCGEARSLWQRYREARRLALAAEKG
jgi:TubC N-terminal docking domain